MKKFSDYLEIISESRIVRHRRLLVSSPKPTPYVKSKIKSISDINKSADRKILKFMNQIDKAFQRFKSKYAEDINKEDVFNFDKLGNYLKTLYGTKNGEKINIYNSLNNFNNVEKFYKTIFGDDTKDIENGDFYFKFFALFDQDILLKDKKINMSDEIIKKINDPELEDSIRGAKESTERNKKYFF